jgi:hypothetical protein
MALSRDTAGSFSSVFETCRSEARADGAPTRSDQLRAFATGVIGLLPFPKCPDSQVLLGSIAWFRMSKGEVGTTEDLDQISQRTWHLLLKVAASQLEEGIEKAAHDLEHGSDPSDTALGDWMPRRFLARYESTFAEKLSEVARFLKQATDSRARLGIPLPWNASQ